MGLRTSDTSRIEKRGKFPKCQSSKTQSISAGGLCTIRRRAHFHKRRKVERKAMLRELCKTFQRTRKFERAIHGLQLDLKVRYQYRNFRRREIFPPDRLLSCGEALRLGKKLPDRLNLHLCQHWQSGDPCTEAPPAACHLRRVWVINSPAIRKEIQGFVKSSARFWSAAMEPAQLPLLPWNQVVWTSRALGLVEAKAVNRSARHRSPRRCRVHRRLVKFFGSVRFSELSSP